MPLNAQQVREVAARGMIDPRTIRRAYKAPERCRATALTRVTIAAASLGLPVPQHPPPATPPTRGA